MDPTAHHRTHRHHRRHPPRQPVSRWLLALLAAALLAAGAACGSGGSGGRTGPDTASGGGGPDSAAAAATIVISEFSYTVPASVAAGSEVTVINRDAVGHTVTADDAAFDVAVARGATVTFTAPEAPGTHPFHCIPHPTMTGELTVR